MNTPRREFLKRTGLGASALAVLPALAGAETPQAMPSPHDSSARAAMRRLLDNERQGTGAQSKWDTTWMQRVKGKHRAMFDVQWVELGYPLLRSGIWVEQVQDAFVAATMRFRSSWITRTGARTTRATCSK